MIFVLSGEGPTDLGVCANAQGQCSDQDFAVGPMSVLIEQMLAPVIGYPLRDLPDRLYYVSKTVLRDKAKAHPQGQRFRSNQRFRSKMTPAETAYFFVNACALGEITLELECETQDTAVAILFRDSDGTRSDSANSWQVKHDSMVSGFTYSQFSQGVPMLPKPTSEAWLLSAAQQQPYQNCHQLEDLPGNEVSPHQPKKKLDEAFGHHKSAQELCEWLDENPFDAEQAAAMPSFKAFRDRLHEVVRAVLY
jgi:hypothetical protein